MPHTNVKTPLPLASLRFSRLSLLSLDYQPSTDEGSLADGQTKTVTDGWLADQGPLRHYDTWRNKGSLGTLMQIIK